MSAGTRIPQQVEGFDTLRELLELMKNPSSLTQASEIARKEMALTEEEKKKTDEARLFIAQFDKLKKEFQDEKNKLAASVLQHEKEVAAFQAAAEEHSKQMASEAAAFAQRLKDRTEAEAKHAADVAKLAADRLKMETEAAASAAKIAAITAANELVKNANDIKSQDLANLEATLKAKAAKLRDAASAL